MLQTLIESRSRKTRSPVGAIASVVAHSALIAGALYATAQASVEKLNVPDAYRPVYFPQAVHAPISSSPHSEKTGAARALWVPPLVRRIDVEINPPTIEFAPNATASADFSPTAFSKPNDDNGRLGREARPGVALDAGQVDRQVALVDGSAPPRYPEVLRASGVEGQVIALFVVDEQGRVEEPSIRFAQAGNALFENSVRIALHRMRFTPAEFEGRKVRQLVQMPFVFTLAR